MKFSKKMCEVCGSEAIVVNPIRCARCFQVEYNLPRYLKTDAGRSFVVKALREHMDPELVLQFAGHELGPDLTFVEAETADGQSLIIGTWRPERTPDGLTSLVVRPLALALKLESMANTGEPTTEADKSEEVQDFTEMEGEDAPS